MSPEEVRVREAVWELTWGLAAGSGVWPNRRLLASTVLLVGVPDNQRQRVARLIEGPPRGQRGRGRPKLRVTRKMQAQQERLRETRDAAIQIIARGMEGVPRDVALREIAKRLGRRPTVLARDIAAMHRKYPKAAPPDEVYRRLLRIRFSKAQPPTT